MELKIDETNKEKLWELIWKIEEKAERGKKYESWWSKLKDYVEERQWDEVLQLIASIENDTQ